MESPAKRLLSAASIVGVVKCVQLELRDERHAQTETYCVQRTSGCSISRPLDQEAGNISRTGAQAKQRLQ